MTYLVLMVIVPPEALEQNLFVLSLLQFPPNLYFVWYFAVAFKTKFRQSWCLSVAKALGIFTICGCDGRCFRRVSNALDDKYAKP